MELLLYLNNLFLGLTSRTSLIKIQFNLDRALNYVWGMKHSGIYLRKKKGAQSPVYLEDGFIHSFGYLKSKIPFSICYDENGIYYNCNSKSDLFKYFNDDLSVENIKRSRKIIKLWKKYSISKYNFPDFIEPPSDKYVLLVDQVFGDLSIYYGGAKRDSFNKMFAFASKNWPDHKIIIKVHPDLINSKKIGCLDKDFYKKENVMVISAQGQINNLIEASTAVCVVTSQVGFEALIYGKEVHVFGKPFYSGLGLTIDHEVNEVSNIKMNITIEQLVFSSLVKYQLFLDPRTKKICDVEDIITYISRKRDIYKFFPRNINGINLTPWKARQINRFVFKAINRRIRFFEKFKRNMKNIIVWGKDIKSDKYISRVDNFISVEDGFVRSVGLGGDLYPPYSLLFDKKGIHYDASKRSDLEDLLQNKILKENEFIRSKNLIKLLVDSKISKYNLKFKKELEFPKNIFNKNTIAVLGQVETDSSIKYGVPDDTIPKTNFSLVKQVRKDYPNSFIIYKPHPDTELGLRAKGTKESSIKEIADFVANNIPLEELFNKVDNIVVFTSLGGFEALIRGISVITYGLPFYAGWGLTQDKLGAHKWAKRRTRKLSIEELVYISLIEYPLYSSLKFDCLTEIENVIQELLSYERKKNLEQYLFKYWGILKDRFTKLIYK